MKTFDVIIAGGGIIGGSLAFELATQKLSVLVLDRQEPGQEASWAAAGMLAPGPESADDAAHVPFARKSLELYPAFVRKIEAASNLKVGFRPDGAIELFFGGDAEGERDRLVTAQRELGLSAEAVGVFEARRMEPSISGDARAAAWLPYEASVDPRLLTRAVLAAASASGAEIRGGISFERARVHGTRCTGAIANGEELAAKHVIVAAGCYCGVLEGIGRYAPTRPVRGQMISLRPGQTKISRVVRSHRGYIVPREDGRIVAGSTTENAGFEKQVTADGIRKILSAAIELAPGLSDAEILETWAGLRPDTPDHMPVIGQTGIEGLWIASGHYRNGILLAPATASFLSEWILRGTASRLLDGFSPLRFAGEEWNVARPGL
ncbi:MAG: glycine oxidase ThiO [Candidatus Acidiferrales bacterium]